MAKEEGKPWLGWAGLATLVGVLVALVVWSLPRGDTRAPDDAGTAAVASSELHEAGTPRTGKLEHLAEASCELAILTEKSEDEAKALDTDALAKRLEPRHCGPACAEVREVVRDHEHVEVEVTTADDYMLPPKESFDAIAPGLTQAERDGIEKRKTVFVVRTRHAPSIDQLAARACFAAASAAAEALAGLVYDETARRIETQPAFATHVITAPLGQPVFAPRQITIQLYRAEDGDARLVTLGMIRYGVDDFIVRGPTMDEAPGVANVMNAVAASAAAMKADVPFVVTLADVLRMSGKNAPADAADKSIRLDVTEAERAEGDPDNDLTELVPPDGATPEGWSAALAALYGEHAQVVTAVDQAALDAVAARAKKELPSAIKRWQDEGATLFVKGPFPVPGDGGTRTEFMWISVSSCDARACTGILANSPGYAMNLTAGNRVKVDRDRTADWLLHLRDGGTAGGESIKVFEKR